MRKKNLRAKRRKKNVYAWNCFDNQKLYAGQLAKLGVSFFVDPAIATDPETKDVTSVTLSYTFFPSKSETKTIAAAIPR